MVDFLTSPLMIGTYFYLLGCILAKRMLVWYNITDLTDPGDKNDWVLSWILVIVLIIRGK